MTSPPLNDTFPYLIRYVGDCNASGHGYAMRGNIAALLTLGIPEEQIDILPWPVGTGMTHDWFYNRFLCARERPLFHGSNHLNIINTHLPDVGRFWTAGWYNVVVAAWETNALPKGTFATGHGKSETVVASLNKCDEIWATTERVGLTLKQSGVTIPIFIIPHALQPELLDTPVKEVQPDFAPKLHPYVGPEDLKHTTPVLFYYVGGWNDRKNVHGLLQAYFATGWTPADPVELVIHSVASGGDMEAQKAHAFITQTQFAALRDSLPSPYDAPIVRVLTDQKPYSWVCKLHQINHVFITATRGEGFCLPAWEAAAAGNMVVLPQDAVPPITCSYNVPTELRPITAMPEVQGYELGQHWWESRVEDMTKAFRQAFDDIRNGEKHMQIQNAARHVRDELSPVAVGKRIKARLMEIKNTMDGSGW